jgi:hypothetical protein
VSNEARQCCWIFLGRQCARIENHLERAAAISPTDTIEADQIHSLPQTPMTEGAPRPM